jgi:hypothetical protein
MDIQSLCQVIKQFDIIDFLSRVSSLRVVFENQDKALLFDYLEKELLQDSNLGNRSRSKISDGKFKKIIDELSQSDLAIYIDPPEYPFVEPVYTPFEAYLFQGINGAQAYYLQHFFDALYFPNSGLDPNFIAKAKTIIMAFSTLSNHIFQECKLDENNLLEYHHSTTIKIGGPRKEIFLFSLETLHNLFKETFFEITQWLFYSKNEGLDLDALEMPFLLINDDALLLDPTNLGMTAVKTVLLFAEKESQKDKLISTFNQVCWENAILDLSNLTNAKQISIPSFSNDNVVKTSLLKSQDDNYLAVIGIFDIGDNLTISSFNSNELKVIDGDALSEPILKFKTYLSSIRGNILDVFSANLMFGFGRPLKANSPVIISKKQLSLGSQEISYILSNEMSDKRFLFDFLNLKNVEINKSSPSVIFGSVNEIAYYSENSHSFYVNDDINIRNTTVDFGFYYAYGYKSRAVLQNKKCIVPDPFLRNKGIMVRRTNRNIYSPIFSNPTIIKSVLLFRHFVLWFYFLTSNDKNVIDNQFGVNLLDLLTYWFSEMESLLNELDSFPIKRIQIIYEKEAEHFFFLRKADNEIEFHITDPSIWPNINNNDDNQDEEEMIIAILSMLLPSSGIIEKAKSVFDDKRKKKTFNASISCGQFLTIETSDSYQIIYPSRAYEEEVLDDLGEELNKERNEGLILSDDGENLLHEAVKILYNRLKKEIQIFDYKSLIEMAYQNVEIAASTLELLKARKENANLLYPENEEAMVKRFFEVSSASACSHLLLEFIASTPSTGEKTCTRFEIGDLLGIINEIVAYGNECELIHYRLCDNSIRLLPSGRLETKYEVQERIKQINIDFSLSEEKSSLPAIELGVYDKIGSNIDEAFFEGYGFTFTDLRTIISGLQEIGATQCEIVKKSKRRDIVNSLTKSFPEISLERTQLILDSLTTLQRENFLNPSPFSQKEAYPWRVNRLLSIIRKPIVKCNDELWWGNESLLLTILYHSYSIASGAEKTLKASKKMEKLMGHVLDFIGNDFNDKVFSKIKEMGSFTCFKDVKKIGKNHLTDENGNQIGDIDILAFCKKVKKVFVIETKRYRWAINPYQISKEFETVFLSKTSSMFNKHKRRFSWVKQHSNLLSILDSDFNETWKIIPLFVTSSPLVSVPYMGIKENVISERELTKPFLFNLKP